MGNKTLDELNLFMNVSDFFVLASLHEGNLTVMFQFLGWEKPLVGTKVGRGAEGHYVR